MTSCVKTVYKTEVSYIKPEIPDSVLESCSPMPSDSIKTNGDLLMSYITLQSLYSICSSKVSSIRMILQSYDNIYLSPINEDIASDK
jgi:hypothetical protein